MIDVFVDPRMFVWPRVENGAEAAIAYVNALITWQSVRNAAWARFAITAETYDVLVSNDCFPVRPAIEIAVARLGLQDIEPRDVSELMMALLQKTQIVEDLLGICECHVNRCDCQPSLWQAEEAAFGTVIDKLVSLIGLGQTLGLLDKERSVLVLNWAQDEPQSITVEACVDYDQRSGGMELDKVITCTIASCRSRRGMYQSFDPVSMWCSSSPSLLHRQSVFARLVAEAPDILDREENHRALTWKFGKRFLETADRLGFMHDRPKSTRLLRAIVETLLNINLGATHRLREGRGPNDAQRTRGDDKAWRRDIDNEFHLHYWETSNCVEFASVVTHADMSIPL